MHTTILNQEPQRFLPEQVTFGRKINAHEGLLNRYDIPSAAVIEYEGVIHNGLKVVTFCQVNTVNERYDYTDQVVEIMNEELGRFTWDCKITLKQL